MNIQKPMKFGLIPINVGAPAPEQIIATAQAAEAAGFESIWTFEHVMLPLQNRSRYPYNETGELGLAPEIPLFDPLITLAALAMKTTTIRLGTGVNIVAQTNPLLLAKQLATLDVLCGGRLIFGAGIGWLQQEFDAMGVPFAGRPPSGRQRCDDPLDLVARLAALVPRPRVNPTRYHGVLAPNHQCRA